MKKTTIYLEEKELRELKILAARIPHGNAARLIRQAVRDLLKKGPDKSEFRFLRKTLRQKPSPTSFGDAVDYQRSLRKEWA